MGRSVPTLDFEAVRQIQIQLELQQQLQRQAKAKKKKKGTTPPPQKPPVSGGGGLFAELFGDIITCAWTRTPLPAGPRAAERPDCVECMGRGDRRLNDGSCVPIVPIFPQWVADGRKVTRM